MQEADPRPWHRFYNAQALTLAGPRPFALSTLLDDAARGYGQRPALSYAGETISYADVHALVSRLATGYAELGIKKGDRVGYMGPAHPVFTFSCFALWHLGAVGVGLNPLYAVSRLVGQARDSGLKAIVTIDDPALIAKASQVVQGCLTPVTLICAKASNLDPGSAVHLPSDVGGSIVSISDLIVSGSPVARAAIEPLRDAAVLQYTGGTTGAPKAARLTHGNLSVNVDQMKSWFPQLQPGREAMLSIAAVTHIAGVGPIQNFTIGLAGKLAVQQRFDPARILDIIEEEGITVILAVSTVFVALLQASAGRKFDWSQIRSVQAGAAPVPLELKRRFKELTGLEITTLYGMTETSPAAVYSLPLPEHAGSTGIPLPFTDVEIRCPLHPERLMPFGEPGEVCIRGPQVMDGYWNREAETAQAFVDGFFRSGDLGNMTEEGVVTVLDRLKDVILASGYNIYPGDVENAILEHPLVREAAVIGVPDSYRGETVKAIVSLRGDQTIELSDLNDFLASRLSPMEIPKQLEIVADIPKNENLKISRLALRERERRGADTATGGQAAVGTTT